MMQELSAQDNNPPIDGRSPSEPAANATVEKSVQLEMLRLLREIALDKQGGSGGSRGSAGSGGGEGGRSRIRKTPDNASFIRRMVSLYCWTHGGCNHLSKDCKQKELGHKDEAKIGKRMGGSNAFCPPCAD